MNGWISVVHMCAVHCLSLSTSKNDFRSFNGIPDGIFHLSANAFHSDEIQTPNRYAERQWKVWQMSNTIP